MEISPPTYVGHENGARGLTPPAARRYARRFNVTPEWLLFGRSSPKTEPREIEPELHDQAAPWTPPPVRQDDTLDAYLAPGVRRRQTFIARTGAQWLGVLAGDVLVIDVKTPPRTGQTVLASVTDGDTAETRILRYVPPVLLDGDPAAPPIPLDQAFVMGPVVALARGPGLMAGQG